MTIIIGCGVSFGEKYTIGNLEIYFDAEAVAERYVESLGDYYVTNNLISDKTQSVQLLFDAESFTLNVVQSDTQHEIQANEQYNLDLLEEDIKQTVFNGMNFRIQVCNANFVPIN